MRFQKLRLLVGLTLIVFVISVTAIISLGILQQPSQQIIATPQKTVAQQVQEVVQQQVAVPTPDNTVQQTTQPDNTVQQAAPQPEPIPVYQPIIHTVRTRAS